jgi:hypothetical protein
MTAQLYRHHHLNRCDYGLSLAVPHEFEQPAVLSECATGQRQVRVADAQSDHNIHPETLILVSNVIQWNLANTYQCCLT